jgi:hypothetical protein
MRPERSVRLSAPFAPGSVSLGIYPVALEEAGFDGVTLSEHCAGFTPGYAKSVLAVRGRWLGGEHNGPPRRQRK